MFGSILRHHICSYSEGWRKIALTEDMVFEVKGGAGSDWQQIGPSATSYSKNDLYDLLESHAFKGNEEKYKGKELSDKFIEFVYEAAKAIYEKEAPTMEEIEDAFTPMYETSGVGEDVITVEDYNQRLKDDPNTIYQWHAIRKYQQKPLPPHICNKWSNIERLINSANENMTPSEMLDYILKQAEEKVAKEERS